MTRYARAIQPAVEAALFKGKVVVIYGARQVGKTTLVKEILGRYPDRSLYLNCDEPDIRSALTNRTSTELRALIGRRDLVVIDEAQRVRDIGLALKLLADNFTDLQVIATGSSSFELSNTISEPLTGRKTEFHLYPLSVAELLTQETPLEAARLLERRLRYGMYPSVVIANDPVETVLEIATSYLYRDVLEYQTVKSSDLLRRLLQALALQVGSEVSYNELGQLLGVDRATVERYIALLEKAFILFHLPPFSRNLRKELAKLRKVYFYDLGIRNALINNFNPLDLRSDSGALWENFFISERIKFNHNRRQHVNAYFWRTYDRAELDYLEEAGGRLLGFECKWSVARWRPPAAFVATYPDSETHLVSRANYLDFLTASAPMQA
ncbi:ATP-binding protein [Candidatus Amarolinea aalborgensis]|jgi:predicted AAA+ superfamily ATPase|uniref:ATP-binding protein n=1 Tax=Candidatus Amarolinea aalborgensis TaxID=2249329 RepID=UPI003BF95CA4